MKFTQWLILSLVTLSVLPLPAAAAPGDGINLQISPLPIELVTEPGRSVTTDLRVRNAGTGTEKLQVRLLKVAADDNGQVKLGEPGPGDEYVKWVKFSRPVFDAPSNEWQTIKMTIDVPKTAAFGYYFAVQYARATPDQPESGRAVARGAVATFILLEARVPGAKREAQITQFSADHKWYEFLPANFKVKLNSTGNVHVSPRGNVFIQKRGRDIATVQMNQVGGNILPGSSRWFETDWRDGFPHYETQTENGQPVLDSRGRPKQRLVWDWGKLTKIRFGRYTAKLVMAYDNGQRDVPIEGTLDFWVVPWRLVGAVLIFGLLAGRGLVGTVRSWWGRLRRLKRS